MEEINDRLTHLLIWTSV